MIRVWRSVRPVIKVYRGSTLQTPVLLSVSPATGGIAGGTVVTLTGYNLTGVTAVVIGGATVIPSAVTDTSVTFTTPAAMVAGAVSIYVKNPTYSSNSVGFTYTGAVATAPTVTSLSVTTGPAAGGTSTTITGTGFVSGATVQFGSSSFVAATFVDASHLTVTTPAGSGAVTVTVKNPDAQTGTLPNAFTYVAAPTVTSFSTASGPFRSLNRNVTGTGFVSGASVKIGGLSCPTVTFNSSTSLTVATPVETSNGGPYDIVVKNPDNQTGTLPAAYTVQCDLLDFSGLRADYAADQGVTSSGGSVSSWAEQSGVGNTIAQAGSNKPTIVAGALNGLPIIRGDGTSQNMSRSSFSMGSGGELFVSMVVKDRTGVYLGGILLFSGAANITTITTLSGGVYAAINGNAAAAGGNIATTFHRVTWVERSNGTQQLWIDGTSVATSTAAAATVDATDIFTMFGDGGAQNFGGIDVAEIAVYNTDHTADLANIESYLTAKWGV